MRNDTLTTIAIAILAMCLATAAHEALGHGSACLLLGGHITQLTSVYFDCSVHREIWIPAGGPLGNLAAALLAWIGLRVATGGRMRLFLMLLFAFSIFWFAGYVLYSAVKSQGDNAIVAQMLFGDPDWRWRAGLGVLSVLVYWIGRSQIAGRTATLRIAWVAGLISAALAALLYAPDRLEALHQAALEIGAASWPLLLPTRAGENEPEVTRSFEWIAMSVLVFIGFAVTLGHGLPS
ncbi:MAG TPA: hypothetical protein VGG48_07000 [Rhizomicrobium sp.]|jgi:hypothetical protein